MAVRRSAAADRPVGMVAADPSRSVLLTVRQMARRPLTVLLTDELEVGRDCDGLLLADTRASRRHAMFRLRDGVVTVCDLQSSNGTALNGNPIGAEPVHVDTGDRVVIGDCHIEIRSVDVDTGLDVAAPNRSATTEVRTAESPGDRPPTSIERLSETVTTDEVVAGLSFVQREASTFTIVFSDIEQSTVLATELGDSAWLAALEVHNELVRTELRRAGGTEIKSQGDGFMLSFDSARRAVGFAINVQQAIRATRAADPTWQLHVRFGIHTGEAVRHADGDLFGRHVIVASRIADQADGDEIVVSSLVRELTEGQLDLRFEPPQTVTLKGIGEQVVHRVAWDPEVRID